VYVLNEAITFFYANKTISEGREEARSYQYQYAETETIQ